MIVSTSQITIVDATVTPIRQMCNQLNDVFDAAFYSNDPFQKSQYHTDLNELYARSLALNMPIVFDEYLGFVPFAERGV